MKLLYWTLLEKAPSISKNRPIFYEKGPSYQNEPCTLLEYWLFPLAFSNRVAVEYRAHFDMKGSFHRIQGGSFYRIHGSFEKDLPAGSRRLLDSCDANVAAECRIWGSFHRIQGTFHRIHGSFDRIAGSQTTRLLRRTYCRRMQNMGLISQNSRLFSQSTGLFCLCADCSTVATQTPPQNAEYGALFTEYRALFTEYRAFFMEYRALFMEYRALSTNIRLF